MLTEAPSPTEGAARPSPCLRHRCHACCVGTTMTLTLGDVARLEGAGFRDFARLGGDGQLRLRQEGGACVLLRAGRCSAYPHRPEGCVLYPLVLDLARDLVETDDFCPHRLEFPFTAEDAARLRHSVAEEEQEAAERREDV